MKNSKRLLATLLTLCIMASFVFTGTAFAADESAATLTFPAQIVNVNGTAKVELAGATADEYVSSDETIAEVSNDGIVTGKAIGRVTITAKENGEAIASVEIPVVGENLLIKKDANGKDINHGKFEGKLASIYQDAFNKFGFVNVPDVVTSARLKITNATHRGIFWGIPTAAESQTAYADSEGLSVINRRTPASGETTVLKYELLIDTKYTKERQIAIRSAQVPNPGVVVTTDPETGAITSTTDYSSCAFGAIPVDNNRLYEMTMWVNYDEVNSDPTTGKKYLNGMTTRLYYNNAEGKQLFNSTTVANDPSAAGWQLLNTTAADRMSYKDKALYAQLYFNAKATVSTFPEGGIGSAYFADASFHEVAYAPTFKSNRHFNDRGVGFTAETEFVHLSNTGKEIVSFDEAGKARTIPVTYNSTHPEVATIDKDGKITAVGVGTTEISATATAGGQTVTITLDPLTINPVTNSEITAAFTPDNTNTNASYNEPTVITITKDDVPGITSKPNGDGTHTVTAPAEKANGSKFLYWAKGLTSQKKILLYKTNELTDYLPDEKYANYLIPVYEDDISAPEYYNANGQLIPGANQGTTVTMPGYGTSIGWIPYGENIYVAKYELDEPAKNITIKTTNCTTDKDEYGYGDLVTCTAQNPGEKTFKCWKKDKEIVSVDPTYTFKAWENCEVEAVYVDDNFKYTGAKMKIIIDAFDVDDETGVMAEFIGLSGAVEKGIMFTDKKSGETTNIAMTTKGSQFSVIADKAGTYVGYAILKNATEGYTLIKDGEYIHN